MSAADTDPNRAEVQNGEHGSGSFVQGVTPETTRRKGKAQSPACPGLSKLLSRETGSE